MITEIDYPYIAVNILFWGLSLEIQVFYNWYIGTALMLLTGWTLFHEFSHLIAARILDYPVTRFVISRNGSHTDIEEPITKEEWRRCWLIAWAGSLFNVFMLGGISLLLGNVADPLYSFVSVGMIVAYYVSEVMLPRSDFRQGLEFQRQARKV